MHSIILLVIVKLILSLIYDFYHNVCLFSVKTVSAKATFPLLQKSSGESKLGTYKVLNKLKA